MMRDGKGAEGRMYGNLEIHHLLRTANHIVDEAHPVLSHFLRREHEVPLPFLRRRHDDLVVWTRHRVVEVELAAGLDLHAPVTDFV